MLKKLFTKTIDAVSGWTDCVATRVPLRRASGPSEVTLDLPGYGQLDSYGCGVVAGVMALNHFQPRASFTAFYARVNPHPAHGTGASRLIRALRQSGLRVSQRRDLVFADLCATIDAGCPVIVVVQNPGVADAHWVVVYGYVGSPSACFSPATVCPCSLRTGCRSAALPGSGRRTATASSAPGRNARCARSGA